MFTIHDRTVGADKFAEISDVIAAMEPFIGEDHVFVAVCSTEAEIVVPMVEWIRTHGHSILLIYGGTPLASAKEQAEQAGCEWLVYGNTMSSIRLAPQKLSASRCPSLYQYSSGTTGQPKLISRSWRNIGMEIESYNRRLASHGLSSLEVLIFSSITHSFGLITGVLAAMERGIHPIIGISNNPKQMVQLLKKHPNHVMYIVPSLLPGLLEWLEAYQTPLHTVVTSGAPLPSLVFHRLRNLATGLIQQYGCTEAGAVSLAIEMMTPHDLGYALDHIQLMNQSEDVKVGGEAELGLTEVPLVIRTAEGETVETGDLVAMDADGRLSFAGRIDDLINVSGLKVQPVQIEEVISRMKQIREVVVYRGEHPIAGDCVKAQVVILEGAVLTAEDIRDWCARCLAEYKVPSEIHIVEQIPRLPNGKISRRMLEQREVQV